MRIVFLVVIAGLLATGSGAEEPVSKTVTITGDAGGAEIAHPGGEVEYLDAESLQLLNQDRSGDRTESAAKSAPESERAPAEAGKTEEPGETSEPKETAPAPVAEKKEPTPEQLAKKKAAIERIQQIRKTGGAYFYTEDGRPLSGEALDEMLESGEMENLKAVDLHQQPYEFDFKALEQDNGATPAR